MSGRRPITLEKLKQEKRDLGTSFNQEYGRACLIGCGIVPTELLDSSGSSTQVFDMGSDIIRLRTDHPLVGRIFFMEGEKSLGQIMLGRGADSDVTIPDYPISKHHCTFQWSKEGYILSDMGSTNGTFVEFERLEPNDPCLIEDRTRLVLGRFGFRFYKSGQSLLEDEDPLSDFTPFG